MGVTRVPSIWDYLAGGITSYQDAREKVKQQQMQNLGLMTQLYGAGAIDSGDLTPALQGAGIKATIRPNKAENQRSILASPDINPATGQPWSDEERAIAGLPTRAEKLETEGKYRYLAGGPVDDRTAAVLKLPTDDEIAMGKELTTEKRFAAVGPRYVDMAVAAQGGVSPKNVNSVIDDAFGRWAADRRAANLPVSPSDRAYFASQAIERMERQEMLRIQEINANKVSGGGGIYGQDMKMYQRYQADVARADATLKTLMSNQMLPMMLQNPKYQNNPLVQDYYKAVQDKQTAQQNLDMIQYGPQNRQPYAPPSGGGAPTPAGATLPPYSSAGGRRVTALPPIEQEMADRVAAGQATLADLANSVRLKRITAAQYNAIREQVLSRRPQGR